MASRARDTKETKNGRTAAMMVRSSNDLPQETRVQMVELLNKQLADHFDLFSMTKQAHWNVKGPQFYQLHELYDEIAARLLAHVDMIAERATALGGIAKDTVRMSAQSSRLPEIGADPLGSMESVNMLVERFALQAESTREAADMAEQAEDMDTNDLFIEVSRDLDKDLWFLEAHLQENK